MEKKSYYITKDGKLLRRENTIYLAFEGEKRPIPVETVYEIHVFSALTVSSQALHLLAQKGVPLHFYNRYGYYEGSFIPRKSILSGDLVIKQADHYLDPGKRMYLARKFLVGALKNMERTLRQYGVEWSAEEYLGEMERKGNVTELMNVEARARKEYYENLDKILPEEFRIGERSRRPPRNRGNALLSLGNSLLYPVIISEIYRTGLHGGVSYLHEPMERRYSLALDVSEVFKPFLVDRTVIYAVNKKIIQKEDFVMEEEGVFLREQALRKFLSLWNERLKKTIKHRRLRRNVSYRRLIRLELYKLIRHFTGLEKYKPFVIWW